MNTVLKAETSFRVPAFEKVGSTLTDCLTVEQALVAGGLDWEVAAMPLLAYTPNGNIEIKDRVANTRIRNGEFDVLGVVGKDYQIVQNHEAFKVLDDIVDMSGANFNAAGALKGGKRQFISMKIPQHIEFSNGDATDLYLFCTNSHDGKSAMRISVTPIRIACTNQIGQITQSALSSFTIRHTSNALNRVQEARETLNLTFTYIDAFQMEVERLIDSEFSGKQYENLVKDLFEYDARDCTERETERFSTLMNLWTAPTQQNIKNTKWAAYNSVVEYLDWFAPAPNATVQAERVLSSAQVQAKKGRVLQML
jgi:phage/plasmid-like protein (TIGR03299 family)